SRLPGALCPPPGQFEPLGSPCTAGTVCTNNACNGAGVCGFVSVNVGAACTDGNVCTVADTCTLTGTCVGAARSCDDLNVCTTDLCTPPAVGCGNLKNGVSCNDGSPATVADTCGVGACVGCVSRCT